MTEDIQETQKSRQERLAGLGEGRGRSKSRRIRSHWVPKEWGYEMTRSE